jgi:ABC-type uncharacterized transport system involved in gliding motility auxiliary subunit
MSNTSSQSHSLARLSLIIGVLGLLILVGGIGLNNFKDLQNLAELMRVLGGILLGIGTAGLITARRQAIYGFSQSRQARFGSQAVILSLSFIGIVALLNYLGMRHPLRWDLTENKSFTLSAQTTRILKNLKEPVKVTAFYKVSNSMRQEMINLLESYRDQANGKLTIEFVDPERQPGIALRYGISTSDVVILERGTLRKTVTGTQEQDVTNALLGVSREKKPIVYFLQGHGELDPEDFDPAKGLSGVKQALEGENYQVSKLYLQASGGKVPADASALVIAGPDKALTPPERQAVADYLGKRPGRVLLLLRPQVQTGLESVVAKYGVQVGNNLVIDAGRNIQNDVSAPAVTEYASHPITKDLLSTIAFFPLVRSVQLISPPPQVNGLELFRSSSDSWAESNLKANMLVKKDPQDTVGPLALAVALSIDISPEAKVGAANIQKSQARLVVFGNASFASNGFARLLGNGDLLLNSLAWLAEQEDLISIRAKDTRDTKLELTNQQNQMVFYVSVVGMPLLMLLLGIFVWWKRR